MKLFFFPDYTSTNPYQDLLYAQMIEDNHEVMGSDIDGAIAFIFSEPEQQTIFHVHWQNVITGPAGNAHEHRILAREFINKLQLFRNLGGSVVWTIHNKLPHDIKFLKAELEFHNALSNVADIIVLHDKTALKIVQAEYKVDTDKVRYVKHGHYIDSYPNQITQSEARDFLNIPKDNFVYGFVGQLRPYKGLDEFIDLAYSSANSADTTGLIAGKPVWPYQKGKVTQLCSPLRGVKVFEGFIPDSDIQLYLNASDVIVLPYRDILTSGSLILAASYGKPVIIPAIDSFKSLFDLPFIFTYDTNDKKGLVAALSKVKSIPTQQKIALGHEALKFAESLDWDKIGTELSLYFGALSGQKNVTYEVKYEDKNVLVNSNQNIKTHNKNEVAICVVNYFSHDQVKELADSLKSNIKSKFTLFVLDNSISKAEEFKLSTIREISYIIRPERNLGYAAGNNVLIKLAKDHGFKKVAILNPDILLTNDIFPDIFANIEKQPDSIFSPLILKDSETISFFRGKIKQHSKTLKIDHELDGRPSDYAPKGIFDTDVLNGCALLFNANLVDRFGYIPEQYFLYFEETDWTAKIKREGGKLLVDSNVSIIHKKSTQSGGLPALTYTYYLLRNSLIFAKNHGYDVNATESKYRETFVTPWKKNIEKRCPPLVNCFQALCNMAFDHGRKEIIHEQDFISQLSNYSDSSNVSSGFIDAKTATGASGWAVSHTEADAPNALLLLINNQKFVKSITASQHRNDIAELGYNPISGFNVDFSGDFESQQIELIDSTTLTKLTKVNGVLDASSVKNVEVTDALLFDINTISGRVDGFRDGKIIGWAYDQANQEIPLELDLLINGEFCTTGFASVHRQDLEDTNMAGGNCSFEFYVEPINITDKEVTCTILLAGSKIELSSRKMKMEVSAKGFDCNTNLSSFLKWSYSNIISPYGMFEKSERLQRECNFIKQTMAIKARFEMQKTAPLMSVIMPAFNRQDVIEVAMMSVIQQSYTNYELIVVDDGSSDNTIQVINDMVDELGLDDKVRLIKLATNQGVSHARNEGLSQAKGDLITYLDSDNEWDLEYLAIVNYHFSQNELSDTAYAGQEIWFNDTLANRKFRTNIRMLPFNRSAIENSNFIDLNVFSHRKNMLDTHGKFREDIRRLVDWELILRYTKDKPPLFIPALLNHYYFGLADNQITSTESYSKNLQKLLEGEN